MVVTPSDGPTQDRSALPSGVTITTLQGPRPGPTVSLLGGVHGDEDEGVLAVLRVLDELRSSELTGTVHAVATANPVAWAAQSRVSPLDGENLARCFPGAGGDGPTHHLAADITRNLIKGADLLIDLHSAGMRYRMPLMCGFVSDVEAADQSRRAAEAFGTPLVWAHTDSSPGRSLSVAAELGVPSIYAECSGGGSIRRHELDTYVAGVLTVLADLGMLPDPGGLNTRKEPHWVYGPGDLDSGMQAKRDGLFVSAVNAGDIVDIDDEIGRCYDYRGRLLEIVRAPRPGVVMFLRRQARTLADDVLFVLADLTPRQE
ncbi:succinylglutamate desuccinylase/aspartoacylase family protein [Haloechinothrix halophila]|uniref:succinylglutamate desuccinylase/aspartoacylase family protein n=1 Tax=Haloechinothrix halophila TaxID=1069073 RepID=UPI0009FDA394|nr:succinylglutamate desuccinylase/aspartoacylase family protein [Haloechinothrix halophila]